MYDDHDKGNDDNDNNDTDKDNTIYIRPRFIKF